MSPDHTVTSRVERELFLRSMSDIMPTSAQIALLTSLFRDVVFTRGDMLFQRGKASEMAYFTIEGSVELRAPDTQPWRFDGASVLGMLDATLDRPYSRDAVAITDVRALALSTDRYFEFLQDNYDFCQSMIASGTGRMVEVMLTMPDPNKIFPEPKGGELLSGPRHRFSLVERLLVLRRVPCFAGASTQALASLAALARESRFSAGDLIAQRGDPSPTVCIIAHGRVVLERDQPAIQAIRGPGDLLEHYAAFSQDARVFTTSAETDVSLLQIDREDLYDRMEEHFDLTRSVFAFMAQERQRFNQTISAQRDTPAELLTGPLDAAALRDELVAAGMQR